MDSKKLEGIIFQSNYLLDSLVVVADIILLTA